MLISIYKTDGDILYKGDVAERNGEADMRQAVGAASRENNMLEEAYLQGHDLSGLTLTDVNFSFANLRGCNLREAQLVHCTFKHADLTRADFTNANCYNSDFEHAQMAKAKLVNAIFSTARLTYADLTKADLSNSEFESADLSSANLTSAVLDHADLYNANLSDLRLANIMTINGLYYNVIVTPGFMQIGCELHTVDQWQGFDDRAISRMEGRAGRRFWTAHRDSLLALARSFIMYGKAWNPSKDMGPEPTPNYKTILAKVMRTDPLTYEEQHVADKAAEEYAANKKAEAYFED